MTNQFIVRGDNDFEFFPGGYNASPFFYLGEDGRLVQDRREAKLFPSVADALEEASHLDYLDMSVLDAETEGEMLDLEMAS